MAKIDDIEFVRTVAVARITRPLSMVRLSAGRESMSEATQALCFLAGANSIFTGDKLLTTANAGDDKDAALFAKLGLTPLSGEEPMRVCEAAERSEEHTSELQSLMRISYAVFCLKKKHKILSNVLKPDTLFLHYLTPPLLSLHCAY